MKRRNLLIGGLAAVAIGALYWLNAGIYLGYDMIPAGHTFYAHGELSHAIMVCHYYDLKKGYSELPAWPAGTKAHALLADGLEPYVVKDGCPGRWPWQERAPVWLKSVLVCGAFVRVEDPFALGIGQNLIAVFVDHGEVQRHPFGAVVLMGF